MDYYVFLVIGGHVVIKRRLEVLCVAMLTTERDAFSMKRSFLELSFHSHPLTYTLQTLTDGKQESSYLE